MHVPRRSFLKTGALTAVSAGLVMGSARFTGAQNPGRSNDIQIPLEAEANAVFSFRRETFDPYLGDYFQAPNARGQMVSLKLIDVSTHKTKDGTKLSTKTPRELRSFSLTFEASEKLPQFTSIHKVSHPALGEFDLFLTLRETKRGDLLYDAVFSHIL